MPRQKFTPLDRLAIAAVYALVGVAGVVVLVVTGAIQGMPS